MFNRSFREQVVPIGDNASAWQPCAGVMIDLDRCALSEPGQRPGGDLNAKN
jgi:hypothetical protein